MNLNRSCLLVAGLISLAGCGVASEEAGGEQTPPLKLEQNREELAFRQCPDEVPAVLAPAADQRLFLKLHADGVQIYDCKANATGAFAWTFRSPRADLTFLGFQVGTHYAGPTWEAFDRSTVVAVRAAGASPDPTAIPWLLLTAASHGPVNGVFNYVTSIQRLNTVGGLAPATGCDATTAAAVAEVPYEADYFFYRQGSANGHNQHCG